MPAKISRRQLAVRLTSLISEQPAQAKQLIRSTAAYLITNKKAAQAHLLVNDIASEMLKTQQHISAEVRSAFALSLDTRSAVTALLKKASGAKTVELREIIQPDLIGGIVVRTPSGEIDTSIKTQLKQIAGGSK